MEHTIEQGLIYAKKYMYQAYSKRVADSFFSSVPPKVTLRTKDVGGRGWHISMSNTNIRMLLSIYPEHPENKITRQGCYELHRKIDYANFFK